MLGIIDPDYFLGGRDDARPRRCAEDAIASSVAEPLGLDASTRPPRASASVADNQMADLLRKVTVEQGHDPRDFVALRLRRRRPDPRVRVRRRGRHRHGRRADDGDRPLRLRRGLLGPPTAPSRSPTRSARRPARADPENHLDIDAINDTFEELEERCKAAMDDDPARALARACSSASAARRTSSRSSVGRGKLDKQAIATSSSRSSRPNYEQIYGEGTALRRAPASRSTPSASRAAWPPSTATSPAGRRRGRAAPPRSRCSASAGHIRRRARSRDRRLSRGVGLRRRLRRPGDPRVARARPSSSARDAGTLRSAAAKSSSPNSRAESVTMRRQDRHRQAHSRSRHLRGDPPPARWRSPTSRRRRSRAISGSPLVTEANDFNVGLYRADGSAVAMGRTVLYHAASIAEIVGTSSRTARRTPASTPATCSSSTTPGRARCTRWTWASSRRSSTTASWSPGRARCATCSTSAACARQLLHGRDRDDQEGLQLPPMKLVDGGVLRTRRLN